MSRLRTDLQSAITLTYDRKVSRLAALQLVRAASLIAIIVAKQSRQSSEREVAALLDQLMEQPRTDLCNDIARM